MIQEVFSDPFTVFSAKSYPGMKGNAATAILKIPANYIYMIVKIESSPLSRHLAKQGLKLTVRTQVRPKKDDK